MNEHYNPRQGSLPATLAELAEVCRVAGYRFEELDPFSHQLVRISTDNHFFFAGIGRVQNYPLNSAVTASIVRDKAFTYRILQAAGIAVPEFGHFFLDPRQAPLRGDGRERADAFSYAARLGFPVFVKPLDGSRGKLTDIAYDENDLDALLAAIGAAHHAALIQPVFAGEDRRLFLIDGEIMFGYRRARPVLIGDGETTIGTLVTRYNETVAGFGISPVALASPFLRQALRSQGLAIDTVLTDGTRFEFSARGNISAGGAILDYTEDAPPALATWAERVMAALGLRVGAIDFFVAPSANNDPQPILIEVNHNPDLAGLIAMGRADRARAIWRRVADTFFAEARRCKG